MKKLITIQINGPSTCHWDICIVEEGATVDEALKELLESDEQYEYFDADEHRMITVYEISDESDFSKDRLSKILKEIEVEEEEYQKQREIETQKYKEEKDKKEYERLKKKFND